MVAMVRTLALANAEVLRGQVADNAGHKLRTFVTRPKNAAARVPVIFFVGWLSCDSMEYPDGETDGFGALMLRLIDKSGYATVRTDKPGVGESQGNCATTDLKTELEGFQAAFDSMNEYEFIDLNRVFVVGLSNGGGFSPLVVRGGAKVRGFVSAGSWGRTWYEHMLDLERRRLVQAGKPPREINDAMKGFTEFYNLYLIKGMTPGQVLAQQAEWKSLWYDSPDGQYGRPAAFYQQLQALNLGAVWQRVDAPVLVLRGTSDTIMSREDSDAIDSTIDQVNAGRERSVEMAGLQNALIVGNKFHAEVIPTILDWMKSRLK